MSLSAEWTHKRERGDQDHFFSQGKGNRCFLTDHNVRETLRAVDRAYLLYDGKVLAHGDSSFLLSDPETREKYLGEDFEE